MIQVGLMAFRLKAGINAEIGVCRERERDDVEGCKAFTYKENMNRTCWLKSKVGKMENANMGVWSAEMACFKRGIYVMYYYKKVILQQSASFEYSYQFFLENHTVCCNPTPILPLKTYMLLSNCK